MALVKSNPKVSILIVSYNTKDLTRRCIQSIFEQTEADYELIIWDNASTDGSAEALSEAFPDIHVIACEDNLGFGPACNRLAEMATGEYLLLLNPDTVVLDHAIDNLLAFAERRPEAKIWGGRTVNNDGTLNHTAAMREVTLWSLFCRMTGLSSVLAGNSMFDREHYAGNRFDGDTPVDVVIGCFFLTPRHFYASLGGFDEAYFMFGEEVDLCMRARQAGARPMVTTHATIIHHVGASDTVAERRQIRLLKGRMRLMRKHWTAPKRQLGILLTQAIPLSRLWASWLLSRVKPTEKNRTTYETHRRIWAARSDWLPGY